MHHTYDYPKQYLYKRIVSAKLFIDKHFAEAIDLNNLCDEAHFSKFHFIRLFKSSFGLTPRQYLIRVRMAHAAQLLQQGCTVTQTCFAVGFESSTSFAALFKRYTNKSPSDYQKLFLLKQRKIKTQPFVYIPNCFAEQYGWKK